MNIYTIIRPGKDQEPCIQAFSSMELATQARTLYEMEGAEIVEIPLEGSPPSLSKWRHYQWPLHLYFVLDEHSSGRPIAAFSEYGVYRDILTDRSKDHPWVDGTLDGLRRSVEIGLKMYRVHMHENGSIGEVVGALGFNAVTTCSAHSFTIDLEARSSETFRGNNWQGGPLFIYVYALNEETAVQQAVPSLTARLAKEQERLHPWAGI